MKCLYCKNECEIKISPFGFTMTVICHLCKIATFGLIKNVKSFFDENLHSHSPI